MFFSDTRDCCLAVLVGSCCHKSDDVVATTKQSTMAYIGADGNVGGPKSTWRSIADFFGAMWNLCTLFFATITNPQAIEAQRTTGRNYAQRNQGRSYRSDTSRPRPKGSNIRGVRDLGDASCKIGGG